MIKTVITIALLGLLVGCAKNPSLSIEYDAMGNVMSKNYTEMSDAQMHYNASEIHDQTQALIAQAKSRAITDTVSGDTNLSKDAKAILLLTAQQQVSAIEYQSFNQVRPLGGYDVLNTLAAQGGDLLKGVGVIYVGGKLVDALGSGGNNVEISGTNNGATIQETNTSYDYEYDALSNNGQAAAGGNATLDNSVEEEEAPIWSQP